MCGGVAKNQVVVRHLSTLVGTPLEVHPNAHLFGALGAALTLRDDPCIQVAGPSTLKDILSRKKADRSYAYGPLVLHLSDYPDFNTGEHYDFHSGPENIPPSP